MSHDDFESERYRVERVIDLLEHVAKRLEAEAYVPVDVLTDAAAFLSTSEEMAYEAMEADDTDVPLSACVEQHSLARRPLREMTEAAQALERGDASAALRFARSAREYVDLRRHHLRLDERLFARTPRPPQLLRQEERANDLAESTDMRHRYDRLIEAAAILDLGVPTAFPAARRQRVGSN